MDVLRKELNEIYRAQGLEGDRLCEAVFEDCCERVRVYAEVSGKCCVMTDMAADRSFFVAGRCGRMLGLSEAETLTRIIARGEDTFDNPDGQRLLAQWGILDTMTARCFVILGHCRGDYPQPKPRREGRVLIVEE